MNRVYDYYIYRITCLLDGRTYVGKRYISGWEDYYGSGDHIKNAVKKYGKENFSREILLELHDITNNEVKKIESLYIRLEWKRGHGEFNHSANSYGGDRYADMPEELYKEEIKKLSESHLIAMNRPEVRKKLSDASLELWKDPEYREKQVEAHLGNKSHLGFKCSEESRRRISESHLGQVAWNKGLKGELRPKYRFQKPDGSYHDTPTPNKTKRYHPNWILLGRIDQLPND
jgi:hypothetical protein